VRAGTCVRDASLEPDLPKPQVAARQSTTRSSWPACYARLGGPIGQPRLVLEPTTVATGIIAASASSSVITCAQNAQCRLGASAQTFSTMLYSKSLAGTINQLALRWCNHRLHAPSARSLVSTVASSPSPCAPRGPHALLTRASRWLSRKRAMGHPRSSTMRGWCRTVACQ